MDNQDDLIQNVFFWEPTFVVAFPLSDERQPVLIFRYKTDQATEKPCFDLPPNQFWHSDKDKAPIIYLGSLGVFFYFFINPLNFWKLLELVPSTRLLPVTTSIGMFWFKPYVV